MDQSFPYTELSDINFIAQVPQFHEKVPSLSFLLYSSMYGGTGVGKSQFVNDATGRQEMTVGHDLHSCTQKVAASQPFVLDGQNVVLFDTPGFDDTTMSDADTLKRIAEFMETMYRRGMKLKGLVYMHRISDLRMAGASARTYRLLRSLCGTENLANVVICTNMWSIPPSEDEVRREDQLKTEFFNSALASGARMVRRTELGQKTAHDVLRMLLPLNPGTPQIMREMIHDNVPLAETEAGKYVEAELRLKLEKQEREIQEIRKELDDALHECNNKAREDLERYRTKKESELSMLRKQLASLAVEIEEGKLFWDQQFEDLRAWRIQAMRLADEQDLQGVLHGIFNTVGCVKSEAFVCSPHQVLSTCICRMAAVDQSGRPLLLIALFGGTGIGKTTFVNDASGGRLPVGHSLESCTREVMKSPEFEVDGKRVVLIDTPGFDDNDVSDVQTLKQIAAFLSETYGAGQRLTGIIYLHRIADNRMGGSSARTFNLFRRMCGTETLRNVVIATNMWSNPPVEIERRREEQLRNEFFKPALDERARLVRRETPGRESAINIVRMLLGQRTYAARIQRELVDQRMPLAGTEVGQQLEMNLRDRVERQQREISQFREEIRAEIQEHGRTVAAEQEEYERQKEREIADLQESIRVLRAGLEQEREVYRMRIRQEQEEWERQQDTAGRRKKNGIGQMIKGFIIKILT